MSCYFCFYVTTRNGWLQRWIKLNYQVNCLLLRQDVFLGRYSRCLTCSHTSQVSIYLLSLRAHNFKLTFLFGKNTFSFTTLVHQSKLFTFWNAQQSKNCFVMNLSLLLKFHWIYWRKAFQIKPWNSWHKIADVFDSFHNTM